MITILKLNSFDEVCASKKIIMGYDVAYLDIKSDEFFGEPQVFVVKSRLGPIGAMARSEFDEMLERSQTARGITKCESYGPSPEVDSKAFDFDRSCGGLRKIMGSSGQYVLSDDARRLERQREYLYKVLDGLAVEGSTIALEALKNVGTIQ